MPSNLPRETLYSAFVGGLHEHVTEKEVSDLFSKYGLIEDMWIGTYKDKNQKYGFIRYSSVEEVTKAVQALDRYWFKNSPIIVDFSKDTIDRVKEYKDSIKAKQTNNLPHHGNRCEQRPKEETTSKKDKDSIHAKQCNNLPQHGNRCEQRPKEETTSKKAALSTKENVKRFSESRTLTHTRGTVPSSGKMSLFSVYVGQLHPDTNENDILDVFSALGAVKDVFLNTYEDTGNKYGFVRFTEVNSALQAVEKMNYKMLKGRALRVQLAHDTVDRLPGNMKISGLMKSGLFPSSAPSDGFSVYVGNIHTAVEKSDLLELFSGCGRVKKAFIKRDQEDEGQTFGFVHFSSFESALNAVRQMNGWKIKGLNLMVQLSHESSIHMPLDLGVGKIVPTLDPTQMTATRRTTPRNPEVESILRRSQLQEAYFSLTSKLVPPKDLLSYKQISTIDGFSSKVCSSKAVLSRQCNFDSQDISQELEKKTNRWAKILFMEKFNEVTSDVDKLIAMALKQATSPTKHRASPNKSPQKHQTSTLLKACVNQPICKKLEHLFPHKPTTANKLSSNSSPTSTLNQKLSALRNSSRNHSTSTPIPPTPAIAAQTHKSPVTLMEHGRRLKRQLRTETDVELNQYKVSMERKQKVIELSSVSGSTTKDNALSHSNDTNNSRNRKDSFEYIQQSQDASCKQTNSNLKRPQTVSKSKNRFEFVEDEGWDKVSKSSLPHMAWASELFCQILDAESPLVSGCKSSSDCSSVSDSGYSTCDKSQLADQASPVLKLDHEYLTMSKDYNNSSYLDDSDW